MKQISLSRRQFLRGAAAAGVLAALGACTDEEVRASGRLRRSGALNILTWPDYIDPDTIADFSGRNGVRVNYVEEWDNASSWTDLVEPTLGRGKASGFDILVPTFWVAERLVRRGWLEPLPLHAIANHVNVDAAYLSPAWDRGGRYQMPWQAGITGIAYSPALTNRAIGSLKDLFDPTFRGRVGMVDQMRESVPLRMLLDGGDPTRPTEPAAMAAIEALRAAKASGQIRKFVGSDYIESLKSGEFALCLAWSGDVVQLQRERPDIRFVIPEEGGMRWFDTMVIPRRAPNVDAAARWMDYAYEPANAARITASVQFVSPVVGVQEELLKRGGDSARLATSPILFPDDATKRRLYFWGGLAADVEDRLDEAFAALL